MIYEGAKDGCFAKIEEWARGVEERARAGQNQQTNQYSSSFEARAGQTQNQPVLNQYIQASLPRGVDGQQMQMQFELQQQQLYHQGSLPLQGNSPNGGGQMMYNHGSSRPLENGQVQYIQNSSPNNKQSGFIQGSLPDGSQMQNQYHGSLPRGIDPQTQYQGSIPKGLDSQFNGSLPRGLNAAQFQGSLPRGLDSQGQSQFQVTPPQMTPTQQVYPSQAFAQPGMSQQFQYMNQNNQNPNPSQNYIAAPMQGQYQNQNSMPFYANQNGNPNLNQSMNQNGSQNLIQNMNQNQNGGQVIQV